MHKKTARIYRVDVLVYNSQNEHQIPMNGAAG